MSPQVQICAQLNNHIHQASALRIIANITQAQVTLLFRCHKSAYPWRENALIRHARPCGPAPSGRAPWRAPQSLLLLQCRIGLRPFWRRTARAGLEARAPPLGARVSRPAFAAAGSVNASRQPAPWGGATGWTSPSPAPTQRPTSPPTASSRDGRDRCCRIRAGCARARPWAACRASSAAAPSTAPIGAC